jgi:rubrerythrin
MPSETNVNDMFRLAVQAERTAELLYKGLADLFAAYPTVADFWMQYAKEESQHATWLLSIQKELSPDQLEAPADPAIVEKLQAVRYFSVEDALNQVRTLEDAYQLVSDLENSETNAVFEFLVDRFAEDARTQAFLRAQLKEHMGNLLINFPTSFGTTTARRLVRVER